MALEVIPQIEIDLGTAAEPLSLLGPAFNLFDSPIKQGFCFGIEALGMCAAMPTEPRNIYLSIGEALSILGLLVAFIQVAEPRFRFRLALAPFPGRKSIYGLFIAGTLVSFAASLWPSVPLYVPAAFVSARFLEASAGILFILAFVIMFWRMTQSAHFSIRNAKDYYQFVLAWIARGELGALQQLAFELSDVIPRIITICKKAEIIHLTKKDRAQIPDYITWVWNLLDLLADPIMAKVLVKGGATALSNLYYEVEKQEAYGLHLRTATISIVRAGLQDKESIFYRENAYGSLGRHKTITRLLFSNFRMIDAYNPLDAFNGYSSDMAGSVEFSLWLEHLKLAVDAYMEHGGARHPSAISSAFERVNQVALNAVFRMNDLPSVGVFETEEYKRLDAAGRVYARIIQAIAKRGNDLKLAKPEKLLERDNFTFLAAVAKGVFEYFGRVASLKFHWDGIRSSCLDIIFELYVLNVEEDKPHIKQIRAILNHMMLERVRMNLLESAYAPMTANLISLFGLKLDDRITNPGQEFSLLLTQELQEHFVNAYIMDKDYALSLLPEDCVYNPDKSVIEIWGLGRMGRRGKKELLGKLKLPPSSTA